MFTPDSSYLTELLFEKGCEIHESTQKVTIKIQKNEICAQIKQFNASPFYVQTLPISPDRFVEEIMNSEFHSSA